MASLALSGLLALLLAVKFVVSGEAMMEDLFQHKGSDIGGLGGGGATSAIVLPNSLGDERAGKDSRSMVESGKAGVISASADSQLPSSCSTSAALAATSSSSSSTSAPSVARGGLYNDSKEAVSCPASCFMPNPVCGMDGVTYWCGSADAECAGVEVDYVGFCDFGSRGTGGKGVLAVQSLLLVHMIWLMLAAFLVLLGVP